MKTNNYTLNLIKELAWADFKLKYYGSFLGLVWTILKPVLMLAVLYLVFAEFLKVDIENYYAYLLLGIIIWNFFADGTKDSMKNIVSKAGILQKIKVSPSVMVISSCIHVYITFLINIIIFFILIYALGIPFYLSTFAFILMLVFAFFLILGVSFINSILYMKFTDYEHLWDVFLQILFWATPIVYSEKLIPEYLKDYFLLNPLARIIIDSRNMILYGFVPESKQLVITAIIIAIIFIIGYYAFTKNSRGAIQHI
jgi:ABC-type polysaccharide/polyol phosphate export permease